MRSLSASYARAEVTYATVLRRDPLLKHSAWRTKFFQREIKPIVMHVSKYVILMIDAKHLVMYRPSTGHSITTCMNDLFSFSPFPLFHEKTTAYSSVRNWPRRLHFGEDRFEPGIHTDKNSDSLIDFKILPDLTGFLFHSVWTLAGTAKIPRSTI
jgi:hypothetical protein